MSPICPITRYSMQKLSLISCLSLLLMLASCTNDPYDTGDGDLSYMRADFVEANTNAASAIVSISTDEGVGLRLTREVKASWAAKPDTAYRALMYYNSLVNEDDGSLVAEPLAMSQVLTPRVSMIGNVTGGMKTDPVLLESAWKSHNAKFINFDMSVKTGKVDGDSEGQTIGVVCDAVEQRADGTSLVRLRLYHDQGGVPEYYSAKLYLSIPMSFLPITPTEGDEVEVSMNTYDGTVVKTFGF